VVPFDNVGRPLRYIESSVSLTSPPGNLEQYCRNLNLEASLIDLATEIASYIPHLNDWFNGRNVTFQSSISNNPIDALDLQCHASVIECYLLRWLDDHTGEAANALPFPLPHANRPLDAAICVSLLIFVVLVADGLDHSFHPLHFTAIVRLREFLEAATSEDWAPAPQVFVWVVLIGTICARNSSEEVWFAEKFQEVCEQYRIWEFETLMMHAVDILWVGYQLDKSARRVWESDVGKRSKSGTPMMLSPR
jgi:hypothetical protein